MAVAEVPIKNKSKIILLNVGSSEDPNFRLFHSSNGNRGHFISYKDAAKCYGVSMRKYPDFVDRRQLNSPHCFATLEQIVSESRFKFYDGHFGYFARLLAELYSLPKVGKLPEHHLLWTMYFIQERKLKGVPIDLAMADRMVYGGTLFLVRASYRKRKEDIQKDLENAIRMYYAAYVIRKASGNSSRDRSPEEWYAKLAENAPRYVEILKEHRRVHS